MIPFITSKQANKHKKRILPFWRIKHSSNFEGYILDEKVKIDTNPTLKICQKKEEKEILDGKTELENIHDKYPDYRDQLKSLYTTAII